MLQILHAVRVSRVCDYTHGAAMVPLGRDSLERLLGVRCVALHRCAERYMGREQLGASLREQTVRPEHQPDGEPARLPERHRRGLPQLPPHLPV